MTRFDAACIIIATIIAVAWGYNPFLVAAGTGAVIVLARTDASYRKG